MIYKSCNFHNAANVLSFNLLRSHEISRRAELKEDSKVAVLPGKVQMSNLYVTKVKIGIENKTFTENNLVGSL